MAQSVHAQLAAHAANPERFRQRVDATLTHAPNGGLEIAYVIHGLNLDLCVPTPHAPAPADALWQTSCCELFLNPAGSAAYRELNFSPSGQWAAYDFSDYRERAATPAIAAPTLVFQREEALLRLDVVLPYAALPRAETLRLAVAVVLETNDGHLGYWALAHPAGKPDFHHHAGFVLSLGPQGFRPSRWP